jgi:SAM-dependent methyltransferase
VLIRTARLITAFARADDKLDWLAGKAAWRGFRARLPVEHEANRAFDVLHGTDTAGEACLVESGVTAEQARGGNGVYRPLWEGMFHTALASLGTPLGGYTFVDLGCGKGKLLLLAAAYPFARIVGIEFAPALLATAQRNIERFRGVHPAAPPIEAVLGDARQWQMPAGPLVALIFNSFDPATTREVMRGIDREAAREAPLFVLYVNLRRVAEAGDGFAGLTHLKRVRASRRLLVFANAPGQAVRQGKGPFG